jgi:NAD(P)-dependent dehydrogenase (short-subunit alcohol dehydrogenase family)
MKLAARLDRKTALVTGGGHGLGRAIAQALAQEGAVVAVCGRKREPLEATAQALRTAGHQAHAFVCDVASEASVGECVQAAEQAMGRIDLLVNNAGIGITAPVARTTLDDWNQVMAINATGTFLCTRACVRGMVERKFGRVVNVSSVAGVSSGPYMGAYSASKHAVIGFTRAAAAELGDKGINVNALCPAYIDTDMMRSGVERAMRTKGISEAEAIKAVLASVGQKRLLTVEEVADWVVSLCAPQSSGLNGQVIVLDGGGNTP